MRTPIDPLHYELGVFPLRLRESFEPFRLPGFSIAAVAVLFAILAEAMAGSYEALLAVERAHMGPLELGAFLTLPAISGIAVTALFGRWHDEKARLWPLLICLAAAVVGYGLAAIVTTPWILMIVALILLGPAKAAYALLFAIAKGYLDGHGAVSESRGMAALRMISSLSWAIGPAIGAGLITAWHYEGVFLGAAGFAMTALVAILAGRLRAAPTKMIDQNVVAPQGWWFLWPAVVALTLFNTAMFMGSNALSIVTVNDLNGSETDVGLLFSLCAGLEVAVMGAYVIWPSKRASRAALALGFALFAAYFLATVLLQNLSVLYWAQILRAIAIGIVSVIGMLYVQEAMPQQPGAAAALFSNTVNAGWLLSGLGTGIWAHSFGYWSIFGLCGVLALVGAAIFALPVTRPRG